MTSPHCHGAQPFEAHNQKGHHWTVKTAQQLRTLAAVPEDWG